MFGFGGLLPVLTILLAGLLTTTIGSIIRDRYTNWVKMARTQKVMAAWRKEQMEAMRKGQQTRLSQLKEAQQGFMKDSMEVQTAPMKSMAWTMFMFIVIFTWLRLFVDVVLQDHGNQWIAVPWSNHLFLNSVYLFPSWVLLYSLLALPFGQIVVRLLKYFHFRRRLQAMGVPRPCWGPRRLPVSRCSSMHRSRCARSGSRAGKRRPWRTRNAKSSPASARNGSGTNRSTESMLGTPGFSTSSLTRATGPRTRSSR